MSRQYYLLCRPKKWISEPDLEKHYSNDLDLHVYDSDGQVAWNFELMCGAIDDAMDADVLQAWLVAIDDLQAGRAESIEKSTEGWAFLMSPKGVTFEGEFGQGSGGPVNLEHFKLAVRTFRDFLNNPKRDPIEVPFPDGDDSRQGS